MTEEKEFIGWRTEGEGIPEHHQLCPDCGVLVGSGLIPRVKHWSECGGKGVVEAMIELHKSGTPITMENVMPVIDSIIDKNKKSNA